MTLKMKKRRRKNIRLNLKLREKREDLNVLRRKMMI